MADRGDPVSARTRYSRAAIRRNALTTLVVTAAAFVAAAALLGLAIPTGQADVFVGYLLAAGVLLTATGAALAVPAGIKGTRTVSEIRALQEQPTGVKVFALLVRLLALIAGTLLLLSGLARQDVLDSFVEGTALRRGVFLLVLVLAASLAYVQTNTLRRPPERPVTAIGTALQWLGILMLLGFGLAAAVLAIYVDSGTEVTLGLMGADVHFFALAAMVGATISLAGSQGLPSLASLVGTDKRAGTTARKNVVMLPVLISFVLLFLVVLLFMIFGVGVAGALTQVTSSPVLLGALASIVVAFAIAIVAAFRMAKAQARQQPLYKKLVDAKRRRERVLMAASGIGAILLFLPAFLLFQGQAVFDLPTDAWVHFLCLGLLVALGPYGFYAASEMRRIRLLEERFPDFLRDVASSHKGGLTLAQSVTVAARGEYGPLGPEVQRMADQLSWNVPFNEALERFGGRVQTPLVQRAVTLILEANRSGGATTDVLLAAARDAREIKTLEEDRRVNMSLYTVVIYVTFFVFLGVTAVLYAQFVPQLVASSKAAQEAALAAGGGAIEGITSNTLDLHQFQLFYFMAAIMQGLGDGIVAGMMGSGKAVLGLRHAFIMVLLSYLTFIFLL